ncbi:hypothetical protein D3C75_670280 [compost metagenome]
MGHLHRSIRLIQAGGHVFRRCSELLGSAHQLGIRAAHRNLGSGLILIGQHNRGLTIDRANVLKRGLHIAAVACQKLIQLSLEGLFREIFGREQQTAHVIPANGQRNQVGLAKLSLDLRSERGKLVDPRIR